MMRLRPSPKRGVRKARCSQNHQCSHSPGGGGKKQAPRRRGGGRASEGDDQNPALIARSVASEELGSSVSFNQVLGTVGSSFGTAVAGAVLAATMAPDLHPGRAGISATLEIGALVCVAVFAALLVHALMTRSRRAPEERAEALRG